MPPPWLLLVAATPALAALYVALPPGSVAQTVAYPSFALAATLMIALAVRARAGEDRRAWQIIALGFGLGVLGDISYSLLSLSAGSVPFPSIADGFYLAKYAAMIFGVFKLVARKGGSDHNPLLDAGIIAIGAASVLWITVVNPALVGIVDPLTSVVSTAYPALDVALMALALRILLTTRQSPAPLKLLALGISSYLFADVIYAVQTFQGTYVYGGPLDTGWIMGVLLVAAAALHPHEARAVSGEAIKPPGRRRLILVGLAALIAPTIVLIHGLAEAQQSLVGLALLWSALFGLVVMRLTSTVDELASSLQQRKRLQGALKHQADHDALTGLANRRLFESNLTEALHSSPETTAVMFIDLDDFKGINDSLGHPAGDAVLRVVADRLTSAVRGNDVAARIGGDEFAVLITECSDLPAAESLAERVLASIRDGAAGDKPVTVRASAGLVMGTASATAAGQMRDADIAMYRAKARGKDRVETYSSGMHVSATREFELRAELPGAIESDQLVLHYQPLVDLQDGVIVGAEALVRWNHPERGLLAPMDFIAIAEESGMMPSLGEWVMRKACASAATWPVLPDGRPVSISVNVSASQLALPEFAEQVVSILRETHLPAQRLIVEVTERALLDDKLVARSLVFLASAGVRLALDDFGTGYSALSVLAQLPFDVVKIDRSLLEASTKSDRGAGVLEGVVALCDSLELVTVAEGIERASQLSRLRALGCHLGQGFYLGRPKPEADFARLLHARQKPASRSRIRTPRLTAHSGS